MELNDVDYNDQNQLLLQLVSKAEFLQKNTNKEVAIVELKRLFVFLIEELTHIHSIQFSTFFSKIAFAANSFGVQGKDLLVTHLWRKYIQHATLEPEIDPAQLGTYVLYTWVNRVNPKIKSELLSAISRPEFKFIEKENFTFSPNIKFVILQVEVKSETLLGYTEEEPHILRKVKYNVEGRNANFTANIKEVDKYMKLPLTVNLINVDVSENKLMTPEALVIDPDFLVDVTAISESFGRGSTNTLGYLTKKYLAIDTSTALLLGNIANMMLDELVYNPTVEFASIAKSIFAVHPLAIAQYNDEEVRALLSKARHHFNNLKSVVQQQFAAVQINSKTSYLEPSFYSTQYGIQGRLDLFHADQDLNQYDIVELKSGKPFKANAYGLNNNHYIQTLLYDLIIRHVLPIGSRSKAYILYSSLEEQALKYAPAIRAQQFEALKVRNTIRVIEHMLAQVDDATHEDIFAYLDPDNLPDEWRFVKRDLTRIQQLISHLSPLEYAYFKHFSGLIAREQHIAKVGSSGGESRGGFSAMWCDSLEQKKELYSSILFLTINAVSFTDGEPILVLDREESSEQLTKFRIGDIAVLYPHIENSKFPLASQVFKCTILDIDQSQVTIRLRNKQQNLEVFHNFKSWHIDPDLIDSSFNSMYQSLFAFFEAPQYRRNLILGIQDAPRHVPAKLHENYLITEKQEHVIAEALAAEDYYLIWGPPGTGKTSKILATLVHELHTYQQKKILIVSFTNRAVDEICEAILHQAGQLFRDRLLRVGSGYSCDPAFKQYLLSEQMKTIDSREDLLALLDKTQIVVSTVSSIIGRRELFDMLNFDIMIVDEASQLLEPMLIGVLPLVSKWILIGDHQQLPAVVAQADELSATKDPILADTIGLVNGRNSLFERLYNFSERQGREHSIGILAEQGRMHVEIMEFVNKHFYQGQLRPIAGVARLTASSCHLLPNDMQQRMLFVQCDSEQDFTQRQNENQAKAIVDLLRHYQAHFIENKLPLDEVSIGIISPFRSQIALINKHINQAQLSVSPHIDTVERFQGGAKDIIIFATAINHPSQFRQLVSLSTQNVDRKLNVAITRAKEQFVLLGDSKILKANAVYSKLYDACATFVSL